MCRRGVDRSGEERSRGMSEKLNEKVKSIHMCNSILHIVLSFEL